jgi:hypothetical protein
MSTNEKNLKKHPIGKVDKRLNQYTGVILNQQKHDEMNAMLEKMELPEAPKEKK